jgi:hypothetical protein
MYERREVPVGVGGCLLHVDWSPVFDPDDQGPRFDADDFAEVLVDDPDDDAALATQGMIRRDSGTDRAPLSGSGGHEAAARSMDVGLPARELLGQLLAIPPCLPVLGALLSVDLSALAPDEAITFVQVMQRQVASLAAVEAEATVVAVSGHPLTEELLVLADAAGTSTPGPPGFASRRQETAEERMIRIHDAAREEYATTLRISQQEAHARIETARLLVGPLTRTLDSLAGGDITLRHAAVLAQAAARLPGAEAITSMVISHAERAELAPVLAQACAALQDRVLPTARRATVSITRTRANRAVLSIDPEGQEHRRRRARCTQDVWVQHEQDGHSLLMARMGTARALACLSAVDAAATDPALEADGTVDCDATIGQRRAAAMARMILTSTGTGTGTGAGMDASTGGSTGTGMDASNGGGSPSHEQPAPRVRVHVDVTVSLDSLLGLDDAPGQLAAGCGRGPRIDVAVDEIRELLADADVDALVRRLVTDPTTGHLLDVGRDRYHVPARLREFVTRRDRTCRFPGCQRRATLCQLDHAIAWDDDGQTSRANLGALCTRHHQLKTHMGWQLTESTADGSCTWTSPDGRRYTRPAQAVLDPPEPQPESHDVPTDPPEPTHPRPADSGTSPEAFPF